MKIKVDEARKIIMAVFGKGVDTSAMSVFESDNDEEVKLYNNDVMFTVSIIYAKHSTEDKARWIYNIVCSDSETNQMSWKYAHPKTLEVFDDPSQAKFETLPFAS